MKRFKRQQTLVAGTSTIPRASGALVETFKADYELQKNGTTGSATASRGLATSAIDSA